MNNPYANGNSNPGNGYPQPGDVPPNPYGGQHQSYGQPNYSQPNYSQPNPAPGPEGYVSYGQGAAPPNIYVPTAGPGGSELNSLKDDAQLWLLVAAGGFWFGFGWITGPLSWYFGSQIRGKYRALGHHPSPAANWAWGLGITTTAIYYLTIIAVVALIVFAIGGALAF